MKSDDVQVLKSYSFFPSHANAVEVQCGVCEVELPIDGLDPYDIYPSSEQSVWAKGSEEELHVRMSLLCHGSPMHSVPVRTRAPSAYDTRRRSVVWDELVKFPLKMRELTRDAELSMSVVGDGGRSVASARMKLFDEKGVLKQGLVKVALRDDDGKSRENAKKRDKGECGDEEYQRLFQKSDHLFRADKLRQVLKRKIERDLELKSKAREQRQQQQQLQMAASGDSAHLPARHRNFRPLGDVTWLDELALARVVETLNELSDRDRCLRAPHASRAERGMLSRALLILELPTFEHPVLWEEKADANAPQIASSHTSSYQRIAVSVPSSSQQHHQQQKILKKATSAPLATVATTKRGAITGPQLVVASSPGSPTPTLKVVERDATRVVDTGDVLGIASPEDEQFFVYDYENSFFNAKTDPIQKKYEALCVDTTRALVDRALKPNVDEAKALATIIASPSDEMTDVEKALVWRFRYTLKGNSKGLPKFLLSVDWLADAEVAQVRELLDDWPDRTPIDIADALKLLGPERAFQHDVVRSFAVDALRSATDEELIAYLLQLVQALRYSERVGGAGGKRRRVSSISKSAVSSTDSVPTTLLVAHGEEGVAPAAAVNSFYPHEAGLDVEEEDDDTPLASFLSQRACASLPVANFVWWYLNVGAEDASDDAACVVFQNFKKRFAKDLYENARGTFETLKAQEQLIVSVLDAQAKARQEKGRRDHKQDRLRALLSELRFPRLVADLGVPMPLDPTVTIRGLRDPKTSPKMYRSAMYPALIAFERQEDVPVQSTQAMPPPPPSSSPSAKKSSTPRSSSAAAAEYYRPRIFPSQRKRRQELPQESTTTDSSKSILDTVGSMFSSSFGGSADESTPAEPAPLARLDSLSSPMARPHSHDSQNSEESHTPSPYRVIVKNGDDLRQDQLVLQFVLLMDLLLKRVNLDLKLTCFRALATGANSGLIEFVEDSQAISGILADNHNSILEFLRKHNRDDSAPDGISEEARDNFTKSTAGYCVITYLLGIGDRHLDNIMICNNGCLFHIDFGFILGKDPKPYPPPFRLTKEMAEAMGYPDGANYTQKFKTKCCQAFNCLRKHAPLLLNLMSLMKDAGIEHLEEESALSKFQDRFRLDLGDEDAERFFLSLINESLNALVPVVLERFHKIAVWMK